MNTGAYVLIVGIIAFFRPCYGYRLDVEKLGMAIAW